MHILLSLIYFSLFLIDYYLILSKGNLGQPIIDLKKIKQGVTLLTTLNIFYLLFIFCFSIFMFYGATSSPIEKTFDRYSNTFASVTLFCSLYHLIINIILLVGHYKSALFSHYLTKYLVYLDVLAIAFSLIFFSLTIEYTSMAGTPTLYQTCLSSPESIGCTACQKGGEFIEINSDNNTSTIQPFVTNENATQDTFVCLTCENLYATDATIEDFSKFPDCREPKP